MRKPSEDTSESCNGMNCWRNMKLMCYCQSRDGSDYGTVSRENRKYLVRENGEALGELPRARWMCSRMADGRILFQQ